MAEIKTSIHTIWSVDINVDDKGKGHWLLMEILKYAIYFGETNGL